MASIHSIVIVLRRSKATTATRDLKGFFDEWEMTLVGIDRMPEEKYLDAMFRSQIEKHPGLKEDMAYYDRLPNGHADKNYSFF